MTEQVDQKQRIAKAVAIILGVLLIACVVVFLVLLVTRSPWRERHAKPMEPVKVTAAPAELGTVDIPIPYGGKVMSLQATRQEIVALVDTPQGQQAIVIDRNSGKILATFQFKPGKP